jgi:hypothetical protein
MITVLSMLRLSEINKYISIWFYLIFINSMKNVKVDFIIFSDVQNLILKLFKLK